MKLMNNKLVLIFLFAFTISFVPYGKVAAQGNRQLVHLARLVIDSAQLENYKAALKESIETAFRVEPGVVMFNAFYEKNNPTHVTVVEVYASDSAYLAHRQTPHFKKYKDEVKDMVQSLELVDVIPIEFASKLK
jgi:quinol monooxygenase YgiN